MSPAVPCDVRLSRLDRFDVRVAGVTYLGAALQGAGGVLARGYSPEEFAVYWRHRQESDEHATHVWTKLTVAEDDGFRAHPRDVEVLRVWPR